MRGGGNRRPDSMKRLAGTCRPDRAAKPGPLGPCAVPPPPKSCTATERRVWNELRPQVSELRVYTPACFTAMKLLVRSLALVEDGRDLAPSGVARLVQSAAQQLAAFGLTPAAAGRVAGAWTPEDDVERGLFRPLSVVPGGKGKMLLAEWKFPRGTLSLGANPRNPSAARVRARPPAGCSRKPARDATVGGARGHSR